MEKSCRKCASKTSSRDMFSKEPGRCMQETILKIRFFSIRVFFSFHSAASTRSQTFRHLFATLHVRWLSHIFNHKACVYQTATGWDLPPDQVTIWLINDAMFVCLLDEFILGFCYSDLTLETGGFEFTSIITLVFLLMDKIIKNKRGLELVTLQVTKHVQKNSFLSSVWPSLRM